MLVETNLTGPPDPESEAAATNLGFLCEYTNSIHLPTEVPFPFGPRRSQHRSPGPRSRGAAHERTVGGRFMRRDGEGWVLTYSPAPLCGRPRGREAGGQRPSITAPRPIENDNRRRSDRHRGWDPARTCTPTSDCSAAGFEKGVGPNRLAPYPCPLLESRPSESAPRLSRNRARTDSGGSRKGKAR